MLGWVAATGDFGIEAGNYILIHFLAFLILGIGWFLYEDYEKAGFFMPTGKKDKGTALQVILYGWLIASLLPSLGYW
jgi:protoheme IX farnesyltransferase